MTKVTYSSVQQNIFCSRKDATWTNLTMLVRQKKTEKGILVHFTMELSGDFFAHIDSTVEVAPSDYFTLSTLREVLHKRISANEEYTASIGDLFTKLASSFLLLGLQDGSLFEDRPTQKFESVCATVI